MKILLSIIFILSSLTANAVILIPGKIENPLRADKILTEKYNSKKQSIARYRKALKERFAARKKAEADRLAALAKNPPNDDQQQTQSKRLQSESGQTIEPIKTLQDVRESSSH
jgi:hypothetical protein